MSYHLLVPAPGTEGTSAIDLPDPGKADITGFITSEDSSDEKGGQVNVDDGSVAGNDGEVVEGDEVEEVLVQVHPLAPEGYHIGGKGFHHSL